MSRLIHPLTLFRHRMFAVEHRRSEPMNSITTALLGVALVFASEVQAGVRTKFPLHKSPRDVPPIEFVDEAGRKLTISHWRCKIVLLNVWATWCPRVE